MIRPKITASNLCAGTPAQGKRTEMVLVEEEIEEEKERSNEAKRRRRIRAEEF